MLLVSCAQRQVETQTLVRTEVDTVYIYPTVRECFDLPKLPDMKYKDISEWILGAYASYNDCRSSVDETRSDIQKHKESHNSHK